jgi:hypothetical protein
MGSRLGIANQSDRRSRYPGAFHLLHTANGRNSLRLTPATIKPTTENQSAW